MTDVTEQDLETTEGDDMDVLGKLLGMTGWT